MDTTTLAMFVLLVFGAIFFLGQFLIVPSFGSSQREMKKLRERLQSLDTDEPVELPANLLRERFRRNPSGLERVMNLIPGLRALARALETPGQSVSGYLYVLYSLIAAALGGALGWYFIRTGYAAAMAGAMTGSLPYFKLRMEQNRRFALFEEQLGGALDVMIRALQAGYPFTETLRHVAREMEDPIAGEFQIAFDEINGGIDFRTAFRNMLTRVPSLSLMAMATTVALQRETGGNLAESLSNISGVIRGRYQFQRKVKTLTAEGRMSAWVLALTPFALFLVMMLNSTEMMTNFIHDPSGQKAIFFGLGMMGVGVLWIRHMLDLDI